MLRIKRILKFRSIKPLVAAMLLSLSVVIGEVAPSEVSAGDSPATIPELASWFDAGQSTVANGEAVKSPVDANGGSPFEQTTSDHQPLYQTGVVNGQPVIRSDGVNDFLESSVATSDLAGAA